MPPELPPRTLALRLDREALIHNWRALDAMSGHASAGAAVKADAYGLGVRQVMPALVEAGARDFFVAHWSEVPGLLPFTAPETIAVLHGPVTAYEAAYARAVGVRPVIDSVAQARVWGEAGGGRCHLMVDTGINRLGISLAELSDPAIRALDVDILMSHLACADEDSARNARQLSAFREAVNMRAADRTSFANSAGIALGPDYAFDLTRPGLSLYGGIPRSDLAGTIRQVAHPQAMVLQVREIKAGDTVGYNATFAAQHDMRIATVSIGYADGYMRCRGGGYLYHEGRELPVLGRVSMDMTVVDIAAVPDLAPGDFVDIPFDLPTEAQRTGLSQYELLTTLGSRFRRH